jgi:hypothetical protein
MGICFLQLSRDCRADVLLMVFCGFDTLAFRNFQEITDQMFLKVIVGFGSFIFCNFQDIAKQMFY